MEAPAIDITVRNREFPLDDRVPRHWHGGGPAVTAFFDNLSVFFPAGERFFISSVKAHRHRIEDPVLLEDVRRFCAQEGMHGREHRRYNELLAERGYPVEEMEQRVIRLLSLVKRTLPKRWQLAATCALEHFTALMAHLLLSDPRLLDGADQTMAALWRWHAVEENEHKAVAFDVYERVGGNLPERAGVMLIASLIFWAKVLEHQVRMMHADGIAGSPRQWWAVGRFLFVSPGPMPKLIPLYLEYFRPGFHPWKLDNRDLLEAWRVAPAT